MPAIKESWHSSKLIQSICYRKLQTIYFSSLRMPAINESFIGVFSPIICVDKRSLNYQRQQLLFVIANRNNYSANFQILGLQFMGRAGFVVGGTETTDRGVNFEWWRDTFHETSPRSCHDPVRGCLWAEGKLAQRVKKNWHPLMLLRRKKKSGWVTDWLWWQNQKSWRHTIVM